MGYVVTNELTLKFDKPYEGLNEANIVVKGITIGEAAEVGPVIEAVPKGLFLEPEADKKRDELFGEFVKRVVSWELMDADQRLVPITVEGMRSLPITVATPMVQAWINATVGIGPKSDQPSNDGDTFPEELIPMETS